MNLPLICLVDTNVPKTANLANDPANIEFELVECVQYCVEAIEHVTNKCQLVLDAGNEIFDEYRQQLCMSGQPGIGDSFMKWVHDTQWRPPEENRVVITKNGDSYDEFPDHDGLQEFDPSDRKFVAVANAHVKKPPILQATDCKWWGWNDALRAVGIVVIFICPDYIRDKYEKKIAP